MQGIRRARDPIEHVRTLILEHEFAEPGDLKRMEKEIKKVGVCRPRSHRLHAMEVISFRAQAGNAYAQLRTCIYCSVAISLQHCVVGRSCYVKVKCGLQEVQKQIDEAKKGAEPPIEDLWNNIYLDPLGAKMRPMEIGLPKIQLPKGSGSAL